MASSARMAETGVQMGDNISKFDLLLVTYGAACIDTIGLMIYTRCPNFRLHIAGNLSEAMIKTKQLTPDVLIIDEEISKAAGFRSFEESLERNKSIVFFLAGSESLRRPVIGTSTALTLSRTISADELQRRMVSVAEELFWRKMSAAGAVMPGAGLGRKKEL
jgi:chemotaxis response regulator CheB